jgi:hypothetical protein
VCLAVVAHEVMRHAVDLQRQAAATGHNPSLPTPPMPNPTPAQDRRPPRAIAGRASGVLWGGGAGRRHARAQHRCCPPADLTCSASSRVGLMMTAPVPLRGMKRALYMSSMQGTRKAKVLPEPAPSDRARAGAGGEHAQVRAQAGVALAPRTAGGGPLGLSSCVGWGLAAAGRQRGRRPWPPSKGGARARAAPGTHLSLLRPARLCLATGRGWCAPAPPSCAGSPARLWLWRWAR